MLKTIVKSVSRVYRNCAIQRYSGSCAPRCPSSEPLDPCTQVTVMHNGMRIATEEVNSPLTCVSLTVAAGSRYETTCTNGISHFIEHMAFQGFKTMNKRKLEEAVISMAGKITVHTTREMQVFSVMVPSECATNAVEKLYRIISDLDINNCQIEEEKYNIYLELADADNDPKQVVFDYLHATAFQGTSLAQRVIGTSENISRFDSNFTSNFMCEHYQPYRLVLATSGAVSHEKIMQYSETRFGCMAPQPCREPQSGPSRFTGSQIIYRDDSMPLCHVAIAFEAPGYTSPLYLHLQVMKHIVGSWDKTQGRGGANAPLVAREVSKANLCEMYQSFYIGYSDVGLWGVYFVADKWKLDEVVGVLQTQWMQLCTMTQSTDVERGINGFQMELARRYDSVVSSAHDIGKQMLYTCGRLSLNDLYGKVYTIDSNHLRETADQILYDRCPAVAAMGPTEALPDYVRIRSGQYWLRL